MLELSSSSNSRENSTSLPGPGAPSPDADSPSDAASPPDDDAHPDADSHDNADSRLPPPPTSPPPSPSTSVVQAPSSAPSSTSESPPPSTSPPSVIPSPAPDVSSPSPAPDGSSPSPAPDGSSPSPAPVGSFLSPAPVGSFLSPAPVGSSPSPAPYGSSPSPAPDGSSPSPAPVGSSPSPAPDGSSPSPAPEGSPLLVLQPENTSLTPSRFSSPSPSPSSPALPPSPSSLSPPPSLSPSPPPVPSLPLPTVPGSSSTTIHPKSPPGTVVSHPPPARHPPPLVPGTPSSPTLKPISTSKSPPQATPTTPNAKLPNHSPQRASPSKNADSTHSSTNQSSSSSDYGTSVIVGITVAGVIIVVVAVVFMIYMKRRRSGDNPKASGSLYGSYGSTRYNAGAGSLEPGGSKSSFAFEELIAITNGFSWENLLGEGGFGCVYKGTLPDGRQVAVKQLKAGSGQGEREFMAEVEIISRIHHRHLVSLVGYCIVENHRLLVYEFVTNKTLEHHLHDTSVPVMDWQKRMKIAIGSARGLAYLHEDCNPKIIHRDIKSANILLDDSFVAKVADFGLAKLSNDTHTHVSTRVVGTFGYMAPEYAASGKLTDRSDVFSFGVVLLELITGRKSVDISQPVGDESLVEWARPLLIKALETGNFEELADPRLEKNYVTSDMYRMIEAAAACVRHSAPKRPRMIQVLRSLDSNEGSSDLSNGVKFGQSRVFDTNQHQSDIEKLRKLAFATNIYTTGDDPSEHV